MKMKRGLKLLTCGVICMSAFAWKVNAEEVTSYEGLASCVSKDNTCQLTENVTITAPIQIAEEVTLDLNGYTLGVNTENYTDMDDALLIVNRGGKLTIDDTSKDKKGLIDGNDEKISASVKMTLKGEGETGEVATLVVNGGTIKGYDYGISGNGYRHGTSITINGGTVTGINSTGIYQPQTGTLTVKGGTITGQTGIEMRSGELVVSGGTIIGEYVPVDVEASGNGPTTKGAGIAVAQHTTEREIKVSINNGTIKGYTGFYESNPQKNEDITKKVSLEITGGTFEAINGGKESVYSENFTEFITNGTFNSDVSDYFKATTDETDSTKNTELYQVITTEGEVQYVVAEEEKLEEGYFGLGFTKEGFEEVFNTQEDYEEVMGVIEETLAKKYTPAIYYELVYGNLLNDGFVTGTEIEELKEAVKVTLDIPTTIEKVKEGYTRKYSVIRVHYNEETKKYETTVLPASENKDGTVTFETDKFSTYVLAYEDTENTKNPKTGDNMLAYFATAIISVIGLMLTTLRITKKQK